MINKTKVCCCCDLDGTLSVPNELPSEDILELCRQLVSRGVQVILVSGKSLGYLSNIAKLFGGQLVIAENGAAYRAAGSSPVYLEESNQDLLMLRRVLGIPERAEGLASISVGGRRGQVVVEGGKECVLTLFCETSYVAHRWPEFVHQEFSRQELYAYLTSVLAEKKLRLDVLTPHRDGSVDVVKLDKNGVPITKARLPYILAQVYGKRVRSCMVGDGINDLPAMQSQGILPVTFSNADPSVIEAVIRLRGIVTERTAPDGGGYPEAVFRLATERKFFGETSAEIAELAALRMPRQPERR
jgi:hypothetical protein